MASISGGGKVVNVVKVLKDALRSWNNAIIYNIYEKSSRLYILHCTKQPSLVLHMYVAKK
jgi:hypothetical protein